MLLAACIASAPEELDRRGDASEPAPQSGVAGETVVRPEVLLSGPPPRSPLEVGDGGKDALGAPGPLLAPGAKRREG
jgi:hypothetical protein